MLVFFLTPYLGISAFFTLSRINEVQTGFARIVFVKSSYELGELSRIA